MTEFPYTLALQLEHRSHDLWHGEDVQPLLVRRADRRFWTYHRCDRVNDYIARAGFLSYIQCGSLMIDHALITALIERWRQETHTFQLRCGEATITLQDVAVLWGIRIDGFPVITDFRTDDVDYVLDFFELAFGFRPPRTAIVNGRILTPIVHTMIIDHEVTDASSEDEIVRRARLLIFVLVNLITADCSISKSYKLQYMPLLMDMDQIACYSWGSAILANLYRQLCQGVRKEAIQIAGPMTLVQVIFYL